MGLNLNLNEEGMVDELEMKSEKNGSSWRGCVCGFAVKMCGEAAGKGVY